jgi:CheY-like chemotaxis protein
MIGYTEFVVQRSPDDASIQEDLGTVLQAGERARKLVQQILTISRDHDEERLPLQLTMTVEEAKGFLRASLPATIVLTVEAPENLPLVLADATQMSQVVMNLCTNAAHAMRDKPGTLTVRLDCEDLGEGRPAQLAALPSGRYVRLTVEDTGHGMDAKTVERIFEPFFTTKGVGEGTGLGLSTVYSIVKQHGGLICVESAPGEGTRFDIFLPCHSGSRAAERPTNSGTHRGTGRIMVVDDEPALGKLLSRILSTMGYTVIIETNGENAVAAILKNPQGVDLVMTDHTMPGMTGLDLAHAIGEMNSEILVILTGGNLRGIDNLDSANVDGLLSKPYNSDAVGRVVRKTLEKAGRKVAEHRADP